MGYIREQRSVNFNLLSVVAGDKKDASQSLSCLLYFMQQFHI